MGDIFRNLLELIKGLFDNIYYLFSSNPILFLIIFLIMVAILTITFIAVHKDRKRRRENQIKYKRQEEATVFVPINDQDADINVEFYTLQERIINSHDQLDRKLVEKIKNKGPKVLAELIPAYDKSTPEIKAHIKYLVKNERMMERYSFRLNRNDYPINILLEAWSCFPDTDTMKEFVELLAHHDEKIQLAGTRLLTNIHDPGMLSPLTAALMWPERFVPARVAEVFASMGTQGATLLALLLSEVEDIHKVRILETIARIEATFPIEQVSGCLKNPSFEIRAAAAMALGAGRSLDAVEPLMRAVTDENWQVRAAVAKAFGMIGDSRCINLLEILSQDKEGWVSAAAKDSLTVFSDI